MYYTNNSKYKLVKFKMFLITLIKYKSKWINCKNVIKLHLEISY